MITQRKKKQRAVLLSFILVAVFFAFTAYARPVPVLNDQSIGDKVEDELDMDSAVDADTIYVTAADGIVTLSGTTDNVLAKDRAARIAETVKGVRSVINNITVMPPVMRTDSDIRESVEDALLMNPVTESYEVDVQVKDHTVTISGTVDSLQEKSICGKVVKGVKGVVAVKNDLEVKPKAVRPDLEIQNEIDAALKWDVLVDHFPITVTVENGTAYLKGTVGSAAEKRRAEIDADVSGVTFVDTTGLKIRDWAKDPKIRKRAYVDKSDADIRRAVQDTLLYDPRVSSFNVDVTVVDGIATLRGEVDNLAAKRAAAQDARNTVGVLIVRNRMKVMPSKQISDAKLETRIIDALTQNPFIDRFKIAADVINGTAYLYGNVDTYFEKAEAERLVSDIRGIVSVKNNLDVREHYLPYTYDPYVDNMYPEDYDWYRYSPTYGFKSDSEIKEDIKDELWWSPYVDQGDITVTVDNGTATLTGVVDSWSEYKAAAENAYEGGAALVRNELQVIGSGS